MKIDETLSKNREMFEQTFNYPVNKDIVFRDFTFRGKSGFVVFIEGMASGDKISDFVLRPLLGRHDPSAHLNSILQISTVSQEQDLGKAVASILQGDCALCIDGEISAYVCEIKGFDKRGVERPQVESSIVGAQESFTETFRTNTTLLRRIIKSPGLTTEILSVGKLNRLTCGVMYMNGIVNMALVDEVKRRLEGIDADFVQSGGMVEQFIEDSGSSLFQTVTTTERPDNTAALLMQGRVAIVVDGSPRVLIAPITLFSMLKTSEESALRTPYASIVRLIRIAAVFAAFLAPALYLAITTFHVEMIPAGLLFSIAKSRMNIPYPAIVELLVMEFSFTLIKEAGRHIPGALGSTIGIVGGLILGEAAVSAGLASQACVIVIAFTGLGNFAIPQYQLSLAAQLLRIMFILCAGFMGFLGVGIAFVILVGYVNSLTSFGVDYVSPVFSGNPPLFPKQPVWEYETRPSELHTKRPRSQPPVSRQWKR